MKTNARLIPLFLALALLFSACQPGSLVRGEGQAGKILFQDDFSNPDSGWDQMMGFDGETNYKSTEVYRIYVSDINRDIWANPGLNFRDARIEVDATKVGGPDKNDYGIICRYQGPDDFYYFIIGSDGLYGIGKIVGGDRALLAPQEEPDPSEHIVLGDGTNRIRADCIGEQLSLYVNGALLLEVQDSDLRGAGDVGLLAGTYDEAGTDIHFDNFTVSRP